MKLSATLNNAAIMYTFVTVFSLSIALSSIDAAPLIKRNETVQISIWTGVVASEY